MAATTHWKDWWCKSVEELMQYCSRLWLYMCDLRSDIPYIVLIQLLPHWDWIQPLLVDIARLASPTISHREIMANHCWRYRKRTARDFDPVRNKGYLYASVMVNLSIASMDKPQYKLHPHTTQVHYQAHLLHRLRKCRARQNNLQSFKSLML